MADVKLPLVGGVSKKALAIGGFASAGVVAFIWIRRRKTSAAAPAAAAADTAGTGGDYTDPGLQDTALGPTYGATGYYDPNTGQFIYGNSGTGQAAAATNQEWAQLAEAYLTQNAGADPAAVSAALGKYLTGRPVDAAEESLIDQAIAAEGYPPQHGPGGDPPGIRTQSGGGPPPHRDGNVQVPGGLEGHTAGHAHDAIVRAHLVPVADPGQHPPDIVTSTTPAAGHSVPKGTRVLITARPAPHKPPHRR